MYLLTARIVKNRHILAGIYFIVFKKIFWTKLGPTLDQSFDTKFGPW